MSNNLAFSIQYSALDLRSLFPEELREALAPSPAYRAKQAFDWLQRKGAASAAEMTDLPKALRVQMGERFLIASCEIARKQVSDIDGTVKYLFRLHDGETVESVVMRYEYGHSICLSTQAGCKMGCAFCASGVNGLTRNLLAGEMLAQMHAAQNDLGLTVSRAVLMGVGEPLDNYDNVLRFLRLVSHPDGLCVSQRKLSLSTCGLVPRIDRLAGEQLGITLSVSLHAPSDEIRSGIMPVNRAYPMDDLLAACRRYIDQTGRRVSFEYAMLRGVNDSADCARELARRLGGMLCHVNLIPANDTALGFQKSEPARVKAFQAVLEGAHINVTVRRSLGRDISAACGQLRQQGGAP